MKTYYATLELDPRSGQWMADIEGLPVHTWGRSLAKVKAYAHLLATAVELNATAACRAVVVTALNPAARAWWERFGFQPLEPDGFDLHLRSADVEATLRRLR